MQSLKPPFNRELLDILNKYIEDVHTMDLSAVKYNDLQDSERFWKLGLQEDNGEHYTSPEHLEYMRTKEYGDKGREEGYAEVTRGINLVQGGDRVPDNIRKRTLELNKKLNSYFMTQFSAVNMYYPENGFMGWHNNANCPGWNVIMSWTPEPHHGFFKFIDPITKETIQLDDDVNMQEGWTVKVGYYGNFEEEDRQVWHCARSYDCERFTLGYVIPDEHKQFWEMMVEDLTE